MKKCSVKKSLSSYATSSIHSQCLNSELLTFNPIDNSMFHTQSYEWIDSRCFNNLDNIPKIIGYTKHYKF